MLLNLQGPGEPPSVPQKNYPAPNVCSAKAENPDPQARLGQVDLLPRGLFLRPPRLPVSSRPGLWLPPERTERGGKETATLPFRPYFSRSNSPNAAYVEGKTK